MNNTWEVLIIPAVPLIVAGLKMLIPKIPKNILPILAALLGFFIELSAYYAGANVNPTVGLILGAAGNGLREIQDQIRKWLSNK